MSNDLIVDRKKFSLNWEDVFEEPDTSNKELVEVETKAVQKEKTLKIGDEVELIKDSLSVCGVKIFADIPGKFLDIYETIRGDQIALVKFFGHAKAKGVYLDQLKRSSNGL